MIIILSYVALNIALTKYLLKNWILRKLFQQKNKIYIFDIDIKAERDKFIIGVFVVLIVIASLLLTKSVSHCVAYCLTLISCLSHQCFCKLSDQELLRFSKCNNLSLGYGAALAYYKNYLKLFIPNILEERIKQFELYHHVSIPKKLYILLPKSCKVPLYIDNSDYVERCRELPPLRKEVSGIPGRIYNITVYQIKAHKYDIGFRCALEYAQPLKNLSSFKNEKIITEAEMYEERELFFQHLVTFLNDDRSSNEYCKILTFDDEKQKVHEVLLEVLSEK